MQYELNYDDLDNVGYDETLFNVFADVHILTEEDFDTKLNQLLDYIYPVKYKYLFDCDMEFLQYHIDRVINNILPCVQRSHLANDNPVGKLPAIAGLKI